LKGFPLVIVLRLIQFMENGATHGFNLEKLNGSDYWSLRVNEKRRLILTPVKYEGKSYWLWIKVLDTHNYNELPQKPIEWELAAGSVETEAVMEEALPELIAHEHVEYYDQHYIVLSSSQQKAKHAKLPLILSGVAGAGKTSTILAMIKEFVEQHSEVPEGEQPKRLLYITKSKALVAKLRTEWTAQNITTPHQVEFESVEELAQRQYSEVSFIEANEFKIWFEKQKAINKAKSKGKDKEKNDEFQFPENGLHIYEEFLHLCGYDTFEEYDDQVGKKDSHAEFGDEKTRRWVWGLYKDYRDYLNSVANEQIDLNFLRLTPTEHYDALFIDEGQDLSRGLFASLTEFAINHQYVACVGGHQQLYGRGCLVSYATSIGKKQNVSVTHHKLAECYRSDDAVTEVANAFLQLKIYATGGTKERNKHEFNFVALSGSTERGYAEWLDDESQLEPYKEDLDNDDFAVVTSEAHFEEAQRFYGGERVYTAKQIKGLEFSRILMHRPFDTPEFESLNSIIGPNVTIAATPEQTFLPKSTAGSSIYNELLNELYVAASRAKHHVTIYQPQNSKVRYLSIPLKQFIVAQNKVPVKSVKTEIFDDKAWQKIYNQVNSLNLPQKQFIAEKIQSQKKLAQSSSSQSNTSKNPETGSASHAPSNKSFSKKITKSQTVPKKNDLSESQDHDLILPPSGPFPRLGFFFAEEKRQNDVPHGSRKQFDFKTVSQRLKRINPAVVYSFDPEDMAYCYSPNTNIIRSASIPSAGQQLDMLEAYCYVEQIIVPHLEKMQRQIEPETFLSWFSSIHTRIADTVALDKKELGVYRSNELIAWHYGIKMYDFLLDHLAQRTIINDNQCATKLSKEFSADKEELIEFIRILRKIEKNKHIQLSTVQVEYMQTQNKLHWKALSILYKLHTAYHDENQHHMTTKEKESIAQIVQICVSPEEIPIKMSLFAKRTVKTLAECPQHDLNNTATFLAEFYYEFMKIRPFENGNLRLAIALMNAVLLSLGFPSISLRDSSEYQKKALFTLQRSRKDLAALIKKRVLEEQKKPSSDANMLDIRSMRINLALSSWRILAKEPDYDLEKIVANPQEIEEFDQLRFRSPHRALIKLLTYPMLRARKIEEVLYPTPVAEILAARQSLSDINLEKLKAGLAHITEHAGWNTQANGQSVWLIMTDLEEAKTVQNRLTQAGVGTIECKPALEQKEAWSVQCQDLDFKKVIKIQTTVQVNQERAFQANF